MFYKILSCKEEVGKLFVPGKFISKDTFMNMESITIHAGLRSESAVVVSRPSLNEDELMISHDVLERLSIPSDIKYQVKLGENSIKLGPVIGLLMVKKGENLTKARLYEFNKYALLYPEMNGLLVAFSADGIDFTDLSVEGYYYNPVSDRGSMTWQKGRFPIPDSIFQRADFPEAIRIKLIEVTGNRMFNSNSFNKWEFWKMVSSYDPNQDYLPYTRPLRSIQDIDYMLEHYDTIYLKPINGTLARGLYKVTKERGSYVFQGKSGSDTTRTSSLEEAKDYIKKVTCSHLYVVQQAVHPIMVNNRHIDFRVIMQKDHSLKWINTGIVAFLGTRGSICSNWGYQTSFEDVFVNYFNFSQEQIYKKKQEVIAVCKKVCDILDLSGENYGDLGFDVIIDESLKPWILETNKRHYHIVPLWINDVQTFYAVKTNPIKYASALSGFNIY